MKSLKVIKKHSGYNTLLTSFTPPLTDKGEIKKIIKEGEEDLKRINSIVKDCYKDKNTNTLDSCKIEVDKLVLLPFLVNQIVDKTFKSHLNEKVF